MSPSEFIFSNKIICRVSRHLVFWLLFSMYILLFRCYLYDIKYLFLSSTYWIRLSNLFLFLPLSISYAYFSLYILLPQYILKSKYKTLFFIVLLLTGLSVTVSYLLSNHFDILFAWDIPFSRAASVRQ